jgi:Right handed beta helix region
MGWPPPFLRILCCVILAVVAGAAAFPATAAARTTYVHDAAGFNRAVALDAASGGRIILLPGRYRDPLLVGRRSAPPLAIVGLHGAVVENMLLDGTRNVTVSRIAFRSLGGLGGLAVVASRRVTLAHLSFSALGTAGRANLALQQSRNVRVLDSNFSHCGDRVPRPVFCLALRKPSRTTITGNTFHDCIGCDFIHGDLGRTVVIHQNRFARALACRQATRKCQHDDLIELFSAKGLTISDNRFGVSQHGGAQLYLSGPVDHVRVVNNLFRRTDPRATGVVPVHGIVVGTLVDRRLPRHVVIVNNTILSGKRKGIHRATSIRLSPRYRLSLGIYRPVIANNVIARQDAPNLACRLARVSVGNVITSGVACTAANQIGPANLNALGHPTAASTLLINHAVHRYAPLRDITGRLRGPRPDIGCFEYPVR